MPPTFLIVDDFLSDPHAARRAALALDYDPAFKAGNYPGLMSSRPLEIPGLDAAVGGLIGQAVRPEPETMHQHCRITLGGDRGASGVHIDPCFYSGILYLSLPEDCRGGTDFFRHRPTGLERAPQDLRGAIDAGYPGPDALIEDVVNKDTLRPAKWEKVMTAPMRFNRLILFSPWLFHNSGLGFGRTPETGRLVHLMFFAAA